MLARINIELFDNSTGEKIASNLSDGNINTGLVPADGEKKLKTWFDTFVRGLNLGRSLTVHFEVTEVKLKKELELFYKVPDVFE